MAKLLGADVLVQCLIQEEVRYIFGIPGAQPTTITDAIARFGREQGIDFIMTRHEQAAAHMADTYARLTRKPGVCLGTVGPGAVDLVPGVYEAYVNSIPMLVLTAQNQTWRSYPDHGSIQGCNHMDLFKPITKWNALVSHWKRIPALVQEAFRMALTGRPGPVHLDLPVDVLFEEGDEAEISILPPASYRATERQQGDPELVARAAQMLAHARRPFIHVGGGGHFSGATDDVVALAEFLGCPISTSASARGTIPEDHPLYLIAMGLGSLRARSEADVFLVLGSRLGAYDLWGKAPAWGQPGQSRLIQVDTAQESIGENREVDLAILGDVGAVARAIRRQLEDIGEERPEHAEMPEYRASQEQWLDNFRALAKSETAPVHPLRMVADVREFFPPNAIAVIDGGNTTIWGHYLTRVYGSGGLLWHGDSGMGGGGLPKAIAAALLRPDQPVFAVLGDGFFAMNMQELETAARLGTKNLVVVVNNDQAFGMIKGAQDSAFAKRYVGVDFVDVRYDEVARACGWYGERVERPEEITPALQRATASGKPALLDVVVDAQANLAPPDMATVVAIWMEGVTFPQY